MLIGPAPLPPLWSLGYHQCRWGYRGAADLARLADRFERHRFPADGLWLDIDYMDGFRVFTIDARHLPQPAATVAALKKRGFRVVPILDPGIKRESGYAVYDSGRMAGAFCLNPTGKNFTGLVWPGQTVFPDFSLPEGRHWWAAHARRFFALGFEGAWLDMNEPATGSVDCRDMRFDHGRSGHDAYHNAYAQLMARATRRAMLAARPNQRPFLLSRAGNTGSQRYCAHWTGDNFSSYRHLYRSLGLQLNLSISGISFNGSDVGGFGDDCTEALLIDWFKAAFLMPFLRNHATRDSRDQEPWAYSDGALEIIRRFVRLRYTLLPYLYNLFIGQEEIGEAILRPLFYDFDDDPKRSLSGIDDQFMVGPAIMQAPFVSRTLTRREVVLPGGKWLRADSGRWVPGGSRLSVRRHRDTTPLFLREGSLIPFQPGERTTNCCDLNHIGLFCCLPIDFRGSAKLRYRADDGISLDYRRGRRTIVEVTARLNKRCLHLALTTVADGFGPIEMVPYTRNRFSAVCFDYDGNVQILHAVKERVRLAGRPFEWYRWDAPSINRDDRR
jgi:alpha-glucosidase